MKTFSIALVAAVLAAAPFAASAQAASAAATNAAATAGLAPANATSSSKSWKVGERVPGSYTSGSRYKADTAALNLPKAPDMHRWIHVGDNAYLINDQTDVIVQITGVAAK